MGGSSARSVPAVIVDLTIGRVALVVNTTDARLYDLTVGAYLRS